MNEIETIKKKIIDDLSAISDKDILEYIAERMAIHAEVARSGKPYLFDPESGCYANDETIAAIEESTIPNSVENIGKEAFYGCASLSSVEIPNTITSIETNTFSNCTGLKEIKIPNSVTTISNGAFQGCTGLLTVSIPSLVDSIEENAFQGCSNIEDVYCYAETVPKTHENAFLDARIEYTTLHIPAIALDGKALGSAKSIDGSVSFSAKQGTVVVAKIGKESVKIAVE